MALVWSGPCVAGVSAQYGTDDPHLDQLLGQCAGPFHTYARVLAENSPPEIVDYSIRSFIASLQAPSQWSATELDHRQAIADGAARAPQEITSNDPATQAAALLGRCIVGAEGRIRRAHGAAAPP